MTCSVQEFEYGTSFSSSRIEFYPATGALSPVLRHGSRSDHVSFLFCRSSYRTCRLDPFAAVGPTRTRTFSRWQKRQELGHRRGDAGELYHIPLILILWEEISSS